MITILLIIIAVALGFGLLKMGFAVIWLLLKLLYVLCIGLPLGIVLLAIGLVLCITILGIPLGKGLFRVAGDVVYPF